MKQYYRLMLGAGSMYAEECHAGNYIGIGFLDKVDFNTVEVSDDWTKFNKRYIPEYLNDNPEKGRTAAGRACATTWMILKGMKKGDIVISPSKEGHYFAAEITGDYYYQPDSELTHRRIVRWFPNTIDPAEVSESLLSSLKAGATYSSLTPYGAEIENLIHGVEAITQESTVSSKAEFVMEKHLEEFIVRNWSNTELGKMYDLHTENEENNGRQYPTDTGPMDILAISKDKRTLLVVELKKGKASDNVVGQILRYMGYIKEVIATENQEVRGVIIALENDPRIRRALLVTPNVEFYRYEMSFNLIKS